MAKKPRVASLLADFLVLAVGLTTSITVQFVGALPVSEIILVVFLPVVLLLHMRRILSREYKALFSLLGIWLFGQMVSDVYRHTATLDWIRGDAAIIFFGLDLLGLIILLRNNERRKLLVVAGTAVGTILVTIFHPSQFALDEPWKFGYASGVISLGVLISSFLYARRSFIAAGLVILGLVAVNLLENYRGPVGGLLLVMALVFPIIPERFGKLRLMPTHGGAIRVAVLMVVSLGAIWIAGNLVDYATSSGLVSEEARAKNEAEKKGGSLLGGRPEIQVSSRAVMDSPILGHGSWPQDPKYIEMLIDIQLDKGQIDSDDMSAFENSLIPTHSHLMGAWVWAGILGAAFWFYILWLTAKATIRVAILRPPMAPIYVSIVSGMFWQIMFSPFGLNVRMSDALAIVIMLDLIAAEPSHARSMLANVRSRIMFNRPRRLPNPRLFPTPR